MNQAQALYHVQRIDLTLGKRRARLEEIERLLGTDKRVATAERALQKTEAALVPWRTRAQDLELEIKTLTTKTADVEQRLYGGTVTNPKELADMQAEVASLKRRRAKLEDDLLEAMIATEDGQESRAAAAQQLTEARTAWEADQGDLVGEREELRQAVTDLTRERATALAAVSEENQRLYAEMRKAKRGHVVAELIDNSCAVCGVAQTSTTAQQIRQGQDLVPCGNCGRILVQL